VEERAGERRPFSHAALSTLGFSDTLPGLHSLSRNDFFAIENLF